MAEDDKPKPVAWKAHFYATKPGHPEYDKTIDLTSPEAVSRFVTQGMDIGVVPEPVAKAIAENTEPGFGYVGINLREEFVMVPVPGSQHDDDGITVRVTVTPLFEDDIVNAVEIPNDARILGTL